MNILEEFIKIRKKFYFINYENDVLVAKRIFYIIKKELDKGKSTFTFKDIIYSLRWSLGISSIYKLTFNNLVKSDDKKIKKERHPKMSTDAKLLAIAKALSILKNSKLIKISDIDDIELETYFHIYFIENENILEDKINTSDFAPISGSKQILTQNMKQAFHHEFIIDYDEIIHEIQTEKYDLLISEIMPILEKKWIESYNIMSGGECLLTKYPTNTEKSVIFNYSHLFHDASMEYDIDILSDYFIEDRTVCVYGISSKKTDSIKSSDSFMQQAETRKWSDNNTDHGHYLGHIIGGSVYANIFPQKREINRGVGLEGKCFRDMERYLEKNPGLFCFSRPIYFDFSNRPFLIEFGYLDKDLKWVMKIFENV
jgi:hypothetical protein